MSFYCCFFPGKLIIFVFNIRSILVLIHTERYMYSQHHLQGRKRSYTL